MSLSPNSVFMLVSIFCVALFVLIAMLYVFGPSPKKQEYKLEDVAVKVKIEDIMNILDSPRSDKDKLKEAVDKFFDHYDELNLSEYRKGQFLFALTVHRNTTTELVVRADKELRRLNPNMDRSLSRTLNRALDARSLN